MGSLADLAKLSPDELEGLNKLSQLNGADKAKMDRLAELDLPPAEYQAAYDRESERNRTSRSTSNRASTNGISSTASTHQDSDVSTTQIVDDRPTATSSRSLTKADWNNIGTLVGNLREKGMSDGTIEQFSYALSPTANAINYIPDEARGYMPSQELIDQAVASANSRLAPGEVAELPDGLLMKLVGYDSKKQIGGDNVLFFGRNVPGADVNGLGMRNGFTGRFLESIQVDDRTSMNAWMTEKGVTFVNLNLNGNQLEAGASDENMIAVEARGIRPGDVEKLPPGYQGARNAMEMMLDPAYVPQSAFDSEGNLRIIDADRDPEADFYLALTGADHYMNLAESGLNVDGSKIDGDKPNFWTTVLDSGVDLNDRGALAEWLRSPAAADLDAFGADRSIVASMLENQLNNPLDLEQLMILGKL